MLTLLATLTRSLSPEMKFRIVVLVDASRDWVPLIRYPLYIPRRSSLLAFPPPSLDSSSPSSRGVRALWHLHTMSPLLEDIARHGFAFHMNVLYEMLTIPLPPLFVTIFSFVRLFLHPFFPLSLQFLFSLFPHLFQSFSASLKENSIRLHYCF